MTRKKPYFSLSPDQFRQEETQKLERDDAIIKASERCEPTKSRHASSLNEKPNSELLEHYLRQFITWLPEMDKRLAIVISRTKRRSNCVFLVSLLIVLLNLCLIVGSHEIRFFKAHAEKIILPAYILAYLGLVYCAALNSRSSRLEKKRKTLCLEDFILERTLGQRIL